MLLVVQIIAGIVLVVGLYGLVVPGGLVKFGRLFRGPSGLRSGVALRAMFAAAFWFAAPASAAPAALRVVAVIFAFGALVLPVMGTARLERTIDWSASIAPNIMRAISFFVTVGGALLLWSVT